MSNKIAVKLALIILQAVRDELQYEDDKKQYWQVCDIIDSLHDLHFED